MDRKANLELILVERLFVSVLVGIQPAELDRLLVQTDDDGLLARFLTVFPDPVPPARPTVKSEEAILVDVFKRLRSLQPNMDAHGAMQPCFVHFDEAAQDILSEFCLQCSEDVSAQSGLIKSRC